jgi:hypothetical protein
LNFGEKKKANCSADRIEAGLALRPHLSPPVRTHAIVVPVALHGGAFSTWWL